MKNEDMVLEKKEVPMVQIEDEIPKIIKKRIKISI